jgi:hypothetical protein
MGDPFATVMLHYPTASTPTRFALAHGRDLRPAKEIIMIGTGTRIALLAAVGCLLLASCAQAKPSTTSASTSPAASSPAATPAAATTAVAAGGSGLTACGLITEQDASAAIGRAAGRGTPGGTAALSECIYAQGALIVSMKTDSKAFYDTSHAAAHAKGAPDVPGIGDSAFKAGTDKFCTLLFVKGTTLVSILFGGIGAQDAAVAVAKIAASKL